MSCRVCMELEEALAKTQRPDSPERLVGLTKAGLRNRAHQREELVLRAELVLTKHRIACAKKDGRMVTDIAQLD